MVRTGAPRVLLGSLPFHAHHDLSRGPGRVVASTLAPSQIIGAADAYRLWASVASLGGTYIKKRLKSQFWVTGIFKGILLRALTLPGPASMGGGCSPPTQWSETGHRASRAPAAAGGKAAANAKINSM